MPYRRDIAIDFSRPGKPRESVYIEMFNGSLRDECLNIHWFWSIAEARRPIEAWRRDHNDSGPRSALGNLIPPEYLALGGFRCPRSRAAKPEANAGPGPPNPSAPLKRDGPDGTVIWTPGNIFKSDDRHSPT